MTDDPRRHDDELRRLLHGAVDDVHPHGTAADIRRRSDEGDPPMTSTSGGRWLPLSLAAAAAMVLVIGGTLWLTNGTGGNPEPPVAGPSSDSSSSTSTSTSPSPSPSTPSPSPTPTPPSSESPDAATHSETVAVYYLGDTLAGPRLFREWHRVDAMDPVGVDASLDEAVGSAPADADYRTLWTATQMHASFDGIGADGQIDIHFAKAPSPQRPSGMTAEEATASIQQLVYTAQAQLKTSAPVTFSTGGTPATSIRRIFGVDVSAPVDRGPSDSTLAPVQISSPAEGATVPGTFTVTGQAAAFEANVQWELRQGDTVVRKSFTTAKECCTLAPYSFTVKDVPPGDYTLVVHDDDASGQGRVNTDTKQVTVE